MIIFTTRGWTGAEIVWTHADGAATYTVSGDEQNAYEVAEDLRDWLDAGARPWAGSISSVTLTVEEDADERRMRFVYTFAGSTPTFISKTPTATWIAMFGDTSASPVTACAASCSGIVGTQKWERESTAEGVRSRSGSLRMEPANASLRIVTGSLAFTPGQVYAWNDAIRQAAQPRRAYVLDERSATWRAVTVGLHGLEHPGGDVKIATGWVDLYGGL